MGPIRRSDELDKQEDRGCEQEGRGAGMRRRGGYEVGETGEAGGKGFFVVKI